MKPSDQTWLYCPSVYTCSEWCRCIAFHFRRQSITMHAQKTGRNGRQDYGEHRINIAALLRLFTCPGCGVPANKPPLFQCIKGNITSMYSTSKNLVNNSTQRRNYPYPWFIKCGGWEISFQSLIIDLIFNRINENIKLQSRA